MRTFAKRGISLLLGLVLAAMPFALTGCGEKDAYQSLPGLDKNQSATLRIAIPYATNKALNNVANAFMTRYPNVKVQLQYVEDYDNNAVKMFKENKFDLILQKDVAYADETVKDEESGENVPTGKTTEDYFYNFAADSEMDFSDTTPQITDNFKHVRTDSNGKEIPYLYCYPLGGETRGVFVNETLLKAYQLDVPTNYPELLSCCEALKAQGLIPIQGGADTAAYGLGIAPAANAVSHNETALAEMKAAKLGVSHYFEDTMQKLYTLATKRYFDYKAVEESGSFLITNELGQAQSFLGLKTDEETLAITKPENGYGSVAFLPYLSSTETLLRSLIEEYELSTEIRFICSPLNEPSENSPVYITPYYGICANKNSAALIWAREFVNFILDEPTNRRYAKDAALIPNIRDALSYVATQYGVEVDKDVTLCGQIRFSSEYNGFSPLSASLRDTIKCSAQKYMLDLNRNSDGSIGYQKDENGQEILYLGNGETAVSKAYVGPEDSEKPGYAFCTLDYYLQLMEQNFSKYREG